MAKPMVRHIALNVQDPAKLATFYTEHFGMEIKETTPRGTVYLSDGYIDVALIHNDSMPWGINHFGFHVDSVEAIEEATQTKTVGNVPGAVAEHWLRDPEGNRVDVTEHLWPV